MARRKKVLTKADQLLDELLADCAGPQAILGEGGLLKQLTARLVERALQGELTHHLQQAAAHPEASPNSRNGYSEKTLQTEQGPMTVQIPRDRRSDFEPVLVPKGQRRLAGLDEKILALYARGNTTRDIQAQLQRCSDVKYFTSEERTREDLYGVEMSADLVSQVTDAVLPELRQWQSRPLDAVYPILWLDALRVKVRHEGRVHNTAIHLVLGVNLEGHKELLGMWLAPEEGSKFWLSVLTERSLFGEYSPNEHRYPEDIRRVIYTTNAIESLNRSFRKVVKTKGSFPSPEAAFKLLYLAMKNIAKKWTMPIPNWKAALARFAIEHPDCFLD